MLALRWSSNTAVQSVLSTRGVITGSGRLFQRLTDDGSRIIHEVSLNGRDGWLFSATSPRTEFVDADQIAIGFASVVALGYPTKIPLRAIHWSQEVLP